MSEIVESHEGNEVRLVGRVSDGVEERALPTGTVISRFRLVIPRVETTMTKGSRVRSDWVECCAWSPAARSAVAEWQVDDHVTVHGALRRRHVSGAVGGVASVVEVEVFDGVRG